MKVIKYQLLLAAALLAGAAIGFFAGEKNPEAKPATEESRDRKTAIADRGESATITALRRRIAELEKQLADLPATNAIAVAARPEPPRFGNPREMLENLRKSDPEQYAQATNRMAQWRRRRAEHAQSTLGFLASVDTSRMSARARTTHETLQELVAHREEIEERLQQEDLSDEVQRQLMDELHQSHRDMRRLNVEERRNLFEETARNLGFKGQDVKEISETLQEVVNATENGWGAWPRRGPGGPGGR